MKTHGTVVTASRTSFYISTDNGHKSKLFHAGLQRGLEPCPLATMALDVTASRFYIEFYNLRSHSRVPDAERPQRRPP